jgi:hypothetical protein
MISLSIELNSHILKKILYGIKITPLIFEIEQLYNIKIILCYRFILKEIFIDL